MRQSYAEAALWFQRAAEQGHGGAQWWRKVAIQGNISAHYALGAAYRDDHTVIWDIVRAKAYLFMASGKTGDIYAGQKPKVVAKPAMDSTEASAAELRARRMASYKVGGPEGGR
jgi:TPR repeat protein